MSTSPHLAAEWQLVYGSGDRPCARGGHSATVIGRTLYVIGGHVFMKKPDPSLQEYPVDILSCDVYMLEVKENLVWNVARAKSSVTFPCPRYAHSATHSPSGNAIFVFGGYGSSYLDDAYLFDIATKTWSQVFPASTDRPLPRYAHTATLFGNEVFIFGGGTQAGTTTRIWRKPLTQGTPPSPRAYHSAILDNHRMLIFGGRAPKLYNCELHSLNFDTMEWSSIQISFPPIPTPAPSKTTSTGLAYHTAVKMKGRMVVVGGLIEGKSCFLGPLFLNLTTREWELIDTTGSTPPPAVRQKHAACLVGDSAGMMMFGGFNSPTDAFDDLFYMELKEISSAHSAEVPQQQQQQSDVDMIPPPSPRTMVVARSTETGKPAEDYNDVRTLTKQEEVFSYGQQLDRVTGRTLSGLTYNELDQLETLHMEALKRISAAKRQQMESERKQMQVTYDAQLAEIQQKLLEHQAHVAELVVLQAQPTAQPGVKQNQSEYQQHAEELQGKLTDAQNEILRLRRKLRNAGLDPDKPIKQQLGVGFGEVKTLAFQQAQSKSAVPSEGAAPLGLGSDLVSETRERIEGFERRREVERKGVTRVPEPVRQGLLEDVGIQNTALQQEREELERIVTNRLQSLSSPTENPLPEEQRLLYYQKYKQYLGRP